jgi:hypothetical protein
MLNISTAATLAELCQFLDYNQTDGTFRWKVARPNMRVGDLAGGRQDHGHYRLRFRARHYYIHHLVWLFETGKWPAKDLDHIDGDRGNNRFSNLREVTPQENHANRKIHRDGRLVGATSAGPNRWRSTIRVDGKRVNLGCFATQEEAHAAYVAARDGATMEKNNG